jgi:hypothetical protein
VFAAGGKEYVAVTVGGTPTSSGGGLASELHVFALGGSQSESPPPTLLAVRSPAARGTQTLPVHASVTSRAPARTSRAQAAAAGARIAIAGGAVPLTLWTAASSNERVVTGRVLLRGKPVSGATVEVDRYVVGRPTDTAGRFTYSVDTTLARRHPVRVVGVSKARVGGRGLTAAEQTALRQASGGITVGYRLLDLRATTLKSGKVLVSGRAVRADGVPAPGVVLLSYRLEGTISDAGGKPVQGATVVTRTLDRDFWTFSQPSAANGHYVSFFSASDEVGADPVPLNVQVAYGRISYSPGTRNVSFKRLQSATMDIKLPAGGTGLPLPSANSYPGAIYRGLLVGVSGPGGTIRPVSARWPDARGRFSLVLPASVRGKTLRFWESDFQTFSRAQARPGGAVDLSTWPKALSPRVSRDVAFLPVRG